MLEILLGLPTNQGKGWKCATCLALEQYKEIDAAGRAWRASGVEAYAYKNLWFVGATNIFRPC